MPVTRRSRTLDRLSRAFFPLGTVPSLFGSLFLHRHLLHHLHARRHPFAHLPKLSLCLLQGGAHLALIARLPSLFHGCQHLVDIGHHFLVVTTASFHYAPHHGAGSRHGALRLRYGYGAP